MVSGQTFFTWLGHSTFLVETPGGKRLLIDPWVDGNPACPADKKDVGRLDVILVTHAHSDHAGDAAAIAGRSGATVVAIVELAAWLQGQGVQHLVPMNKGGSVEVAGLRVTMVHADHTSGADSGGRIVYAGEPAGFVVRLENGLTFYHAGDTALFGDMRLIGELYRPDLACLPIGDHFTMGPREAAYAAHLLGVRRVIPMHYGTFPLLTGTPDALREALAAHPGVEVLALAPGERVAV